MVEPQNWLTRGFSSGILPRGHLEDTRIKLPIAGRRASMGMIKRAAAALAALLLAAEGGLASPLGLSLQTSKVALSTGALELAIVATPATPALKHVTIDTLVDTTGTARVTDLVRRIADWWVLRSTGDLILAALRGCSRK